MAKPVKKTPTEAVRIDAAGAQLPADIGWPEEPRGLVLFAHGSGSSRHSPRNQFVADHLHAGGLVTVLADLLTTEEEERDQRTAALRFDIGMLAERLTALADWAAADPRTAGLPAGLFGASTGAAAALVTAAARPGQVRAVVSRGGRPDLAGEALAEVRQPVLLIAGELDWPVIEIARAAAAVISGPSRLEIVPRATHLFSEDGALETVAELARGWFGRHLTP
jgi:putative phosphoribosyl transferase